MITLNNFLKSLLSFFLILFISCNNEPYEGPIPGPVTPVVNGEFKVDFDGQTYVSTTTQAIVNNDYVSITATKANGEFFQITIPEAVVGSYNLNIDPVNFALIYSTGSGAIPFMAVDDQNGPFAGFANYTDTAQIVITNIDTVNKKISGTFKFTGVKFTDNTGNTVTTKVFTNGSFTNLSYTADVPPPTTNNTFFAKMDGVDFIPTNVTGVQSTGVISVIGRRGSVENIGLTFPNTTTAGTVYNFTPLSDERGQYIMDSSFTGIYGGTGTMTIISHNTTTKRVKGTFSFLAATLLPPFLTRNITVGTFDVTYF